MQITRGSDSTYYCFHCLFDIYKLYNTKIRFYSFRTIIFIFIPVSREGYFRLGEALYVLKINMLQNDRREDVHFKRFQSSKILIDRGKKKLQKTMLLVYFFYFWNAKSN